MRRRTARNLGIGATATVAATALVSGVAGPPGIPVDPAPAAASELARFSDCEELRQWYVEAALPHVTAWGLAGGPIIPLPVTAQSRDLMAAAPARAEGAADQAVANGETGTNVQEAGVDEPDLAKTDGSLVAHVHRRQVVLTDTGGEVPRRLATVRLPRGLDAAELLLVGERLVVLGTTWQVWRGPAVSDAMERRVSLPHGGGPAMTRVLVVDVGVPSSPVVEDDTTFDGNLVSARQYGDVVRLVVSTSTPRIDFVQPRRGRTPREARAENRRLVRESRIQDWLPTVESGGASSPLVECRDVSHPDESSGFGTVTVVGFTPDDPGARRTTAVTTSSDIVYSSADRLYLATSSFGWWDDGRKEPPATAVHAFALDGPETAYVASGEVPGQVRDRWSMSEHDGHLRVATALGRNPWNPTENAVVVLVEQGEALNEVGRVGRMGIRERIQSVRWFDEVAVVVTFRQVDPLYTLDLSDPGRPRVVGELKIPGFSSYLHPVGGELLLGLGQDATPRGRTLGAQASVFDVADLADPRRVDTLAFGRRTEFAAAGDPRAFAYLPERRTVLAALGDWDGGNRVVVLAVGEDGSLTRRGSHDVPGWDAAAVRTLPLVDGRIALVVGRTVRLLRS
ncbi:MAG TPA: beta-propeller domain-containing protein [Nocardioidaceae bacterium]|nr:beta-propeller domain-containing protein [Nocardioidaceae bacterium]